MSHPVVIVGAGAAGLMAAIFAAREGARVTLVERTRTGGKKIVVAGGGRCNVLPSEVNPAQFVTHSSPNLLRRMLLSWPLDEQIRFFEDDLGIPLALEAETGKLFPASNRATDVRDALTRACRQLDVDMRFKTTVTDLERVPSGWCVETDHGTLEAISVVIATGGLSVPKTGSDGFGLAVAERLGHQLEDTYPALTPLLADAAPHAELSGVSLNAAVEAPLKKGRFQTEGGFLFTHRGYSGPAVLNVSHLTTLARRAGESQPIRVRWTALDASAWDAELRQTGSGTVASLLRSHLPTRLADALMAEAEVPQDRTRAELRRDERKRLIRVLTAFELPWTGDEGYKKAEVTGGGVGLAEVHPHTLESRRQPGLYFCGEVLDAFGPIGGYNFMWAWSTGRAAGIASATSG
ncbi:MAG: aminoacetone oxidase family FAD-binding enzyme [Rubricoccaceae bacterium]